MTETMAVAGYITAGQRILSRLRNANVSPATPVYAALVQEATANTLTAIAIILDGQERPAVPGLTRGYEITTEQTGNGNRNWRYVLTGPLFSFASRYRWGDSETALIAGIRHAREQERQRSELSPLLEAASEAQAVADQMWAQIFQAGSFTESLNIVMQWVNVT